MGLWHLTTYPSCRLQDSTQVRPLVKNRQDRHWSDPGPQQPASEHRGSHTIRFKTAKNMIIIGVIMAVENLYKWFRMQRHDWSSTSPREPMLHLSLSPCTGYQLQLASSSRHWCLHIEQSQAQHPPTSTHYYELTSPPEAWDLLVSDASWYHHREAQNHSPEHSLSPFLAGGMIFPPPSGILDPCQFSSNNWKLISFNSTWLYKKKKKKNLFHFFKIFIFLFIFLSFPC